MNKSACGDEGARIRHVAAFEVVDRLARRGRRWRQCIEAGEFESVMAGAMGGTKERRENCERKEAGKGEQAGKL